METTHSSQILGPKTPGTACAEARQSGLDPFPRLPYVSPRLGFFQDAISA